MIELRFIRCWTRRRRSTSAWHAPIALTVALAMGAAAAKDSRSEEATRILRGAPRSGHARAEWIVAHARSLPDARVARDLMEAAADMSGESAMEARLWLARYWISAGESARGREWLQQIESPPAARLADEFAYWSVRAGMEVKPASSAQPTSVPPWPIMLRLVSPPSGDNPSADVREFLGLEGVCRRWGLIGPWLWRLVHSSDAQLRVAGRDAIPGSFAQISAAPEFSDLAREVPSLPQSRRAESSRRQEWEPGGGREPEGESGAEMERFAVQVGAYPTAQEAEALARELRRHGFSGHTAETSRSGQAPLHSVRLAARTQADAESLGQVLNRELMLPYRIIELP